MPRKTTLLLDTNVWSYIGDEGMLPQMLKVCRSGRIAFMVAPASVSEARKLDNVSIRRRILEAMTHDRWTRLMPEAYLEAQEIKSLLLKMRPQWAVEVKNFSDFNKCRYDWLRRTGGFWERARNDINPPTTDESIRAAAENKLAQEQTRAIRNKFKVGSQTGALTHLQKAVIELDDPIAEMTTVDYWRLPSFYSLVSELQIFASPYREWLDCEIDVNAMFSDFLDLERVWFKEIKPEHVKRQWLRSSMEFLQRWHRPTDGSPVDSQLTSHLVDADYFVTADNNFAKCVERIRLEAPFQTAKMLKIPAGNAGVAELIKFTEQI